MTIRCRRSITDKHFKKTLAGDYVSAMEQNTARGQLQSSLDIGLSFHLVDGFKEHLTTTHEFLEIFRQ
jgi:hypothetical protein